VSESIFGAADVLLVPTIPTTLSVRTLEQLGNFLGNGGKKTKSSPTVLTFFSLADRRKRLHRDVMAALSERPDVLEAAVPSATEVEQMGTHRAPVAEFAPSSRAARCYEDLWSAIRKSTA
jgi:cellulose biosynthesis protein BcsQ